MIARTEDAYKYLHQVKVEFKDRPQIYDDFLHIMKTFKSQEIDVPEAILLVTHLFEGHSFLILGFNTFLPEGFRIEIPNHGKNGTVNYYIPRSTHPILIPIQHAHDCAIRQDQSLSPSSSTTIDFDNAVVTFGNKMKMTFANDSGAHKRFSKIMESYHDTQRGVQEVLDEAFVLFADHPVLLRDFVFYFLAQ